MVSREWGGRYKFRTREFYPNESMETAGVRPQGLKRQPKSTTEELEDGDQDDADADMKMLGAVREEPVITIGLDRETLAECEVDEESFIDDVNGGGRGFLDPDLVRDARSERVCLAPRDAGVLSQPVSVVLTK